MRISSRTWRRVALYGTAVVIAAAAVGVPRLVLRLAPKVVVRKIDLEAARSNEATRLLVDYVRIRTENPPGLTREAVAFWARLFGCEGIPYEVVGSDPDRPILVARLSGRTRQGALLLLSHMDVYPAGDLEKWKKPPFSGAAGTAEDAPYIYGRGTLDMKNLGVAFFLAMAQLKRDGIEPLRDVVFVAEPGEESFEPRIGIGWLLEKRPDLLEGVTDVYNEGGVNETLGDRIERFGIEVLQKATISLIAEAARKEDLEELRKFLESRMPLEAYSLTEETKDFLHFIGPSRSDLWGHFMDDAEASIKAGTFTEGIPEVYRSLMRDMYYFGDVKEEPGGRFSQPLVATLLPGRSVAARWAELRTWAGERRVTLKVRFLTEDSVPTPRTGHAWDAARTVFQLDKGRAEVGLYVLSATYTDSSYLRVRGFRTYGISTFNVNFVDAVRVHGMNERIDVGSLVEGVDRMKAIVREFATAP